MKKAKKKRGVYCSMKEFEKKFFPKSVQARKAREITDPYSMGVSLADECLRKIRKELATP